MLANEDSHTAADLARKIIGASPRLRPAWLLLARCFVAQQAYDMALLCLNLMPAPPGAPRNGMDPLHGIMPARPQAITKPQARALRRDHSLAHRHALLAAHRLPARCPSLPPPHA